VKEFIEKYKDGIHGVLSCFDRMLFRGYLPIMSGWQMAQFFNSSGIPFSGTEDVSSTKRRTCEAARPLHRPTRRTAPSISPGENQERGSCSTIQRMRSALWTASRLANNSLQNGPQKPSIR